MNSYLQSMKLKSLCTSCKCIASCYLNSGMPKCQLSCFAGFQKYNGMKPEQRQKHVSRANWILGGQPLHFQKIQPQGLAGADLLHSARIQSNGEASSSQRTYELPVTGLSDGLISPARAASGQRKPAQVPVAHEDQDGPNEAPGERDKCFSGLASTVSASMNGYLNLNKACLN